MVDIKNTSKWQPSASFEQLKTRAKILAAIRQYFLNHDVLEVETPLASHFGVTDVHLNNLTTSISTNIATSFSKSSVKPNQTNLQLQTSPEFAMKRLLAAGSGSIYQICKAFRDDEVGRHHNPEFTMLEWYRLDFNHHQLIEDMVQLIECVAKNAELVMPSVSKRTYQSCFEEVLNINPHTAIESEINTLCKQYLPGLELDECDKIQALFTLIIEPKFDPKQLLFVYDFPADQASLARISSNSDGVSVASRFECYCHHIELANGFFELSDAAELQLRFEKDNQRRKAIGKPERAIDIRLIDALKHGLPFCSGVALGIDRLVMALTKAKHISDTLAFDINNA